MGFARARMQDTDGMARCKLLDQHSASVCYIDTTLGFSRIIDYFGVSLLHRKTLQTSHHGLHIIDRSKLDSSAACG